MEPTLFSGDIIISDNRHYDPMFETGESEDIRVIGKVRSVVHNM